MTVIVIVTVTVIQQSAAMHWHDELECANGIACKVSSWEAESKCKNTCLLSQITLWSSRLEPFRLSLSSVVVGAAQSQCHPAEWHWIYILGVLLKGLFSHLFPI